MDHETSVVEDLERVLDDGNAEPIKISYGMIKHITKDFAQVIGQGGFAVVYLGGVRNGMVAVKKLYMSQESFYQQYLDEVDVLKKMRHQNIVRFLGYCISQQMMMEVQGDRIVEVHQWFLCFEYAPNGNLHDLLREKTEWDIRYKIFKEICQGLHYLHRERIYHLDLKPANVLLGAQMEAKITDFGISRCIDEHQSTIITANLCGTLGYMAPELIDSGQISLKSDIYSLGIILIRLLTQSHGDLSQWYETLTIDCPQIKECIEIAQSCVDHNPGRRPNIVEIIHLLSTTEMSQMVPPIINEPSNDPTSSLYQVVKRFQALSAQTLHSSTADIYRELADLESVLGGSKKPRELSYQLLQYITENFSNERIIGNGGFSKIYMGIGGVAVKRLSWPHNSDELKFLQEVKSTRVAQHINVVRFVGHCSYTEGKEVEFEGKIVLADVLEKLLCFEYLRNGSLRNYLSDASRKVEWTERYQIIKGICEGLHHLHEKKVVHLDLKPENILLDDNMVPKIADFGLARCFGIDQSWTSTSNCAGTIGYMAPETVNQLITFKSDIYSLGVVISEILTGHKSFSLEDVLENWRNILQMSSTGTDSHLDQVRVCAEISMACLKEETSERPDTQHIMDMLVEN